MKIDKWYPSIVSAKVKHLTEEQKDAVRRLSAPSQLDVKDMSTANSILNLVGTAGSKMRFNIHYWV